MDDADVLALREHVQTRCLPGARRAHERSERPGLDVSKHVVQQSSGTLGDGDVVVHALPREALLRELDGALRARVRLDVRVGRLVGPLLRLAFLAFLETLVRGLELGVFLRVDEDGRALAVLLRYRVRLAENCAWTENVRGSTR